MGRLAVALFLSLWIIPISILVNRIVPDPYMDEIFHIPQAQQYCKGNFRTWDPMITTPPGLYYLSLPYIASMLPGMRLVRRALAFSDACSTAVLRSTNYVLAVTCSIIVYEILNQLKPALGERKTTVCAIVLALYPLHWFFSFLYYTDVASLTAVLAMYLMCLKKSNRFSALLGAVAVLIRQTNIVWVVFTACVGIINVTTANRRKVIQDHNNISEKESQPLKNKHDDKALNLRRRKSDKTLDDTKQCDSTKVSIHGLDFIDEVQFILLTSWHLKWEILVSFSPFLLVLLAFLAFIRWNGSIVLGAKEAHTASLHFPQMLYFSLVSAFQVAPLLLSPNRVAELVYSIRNNLLFNAIKMLLVLIFSLMAVHFFSIAHPYLLADNRHYTFYLWRKVISANWLMKYLLVPLYTFAWFCILNNLRKTQTQLWILAYFLATATVLIPAPLIEFRYYTIPFYIFMLHTHQSDYRSWILIGIGYAVINVFTMFMFLYRPFSWDHEPGTQRFIW
uniref:Dol-P-Glc:Glc(2)Man(9)GlcNAc(2)-PP-Dol alpha-1,2-glucosyltransferase n=3 Tax=Kalanchoe fedtschenkoi TaxID=63787 RepID=A0A7N0UFT4_KALFE